MALAQMQRQLQTLYDVSLEHSVEDYLVTDRAFLDAVSRESRGRDTPERLLFAESGGELLVSLYLDRDLVDGLATSDPYTRLDAANLKEFCTALEGVSHFVYLLFNATHQRPVSRLELELQAEVDKFFAVWMLSATQGRALDVESLSAWLFDRCRFDPALGDGERDRYETANRLARAFCKRLHEVLESDGGEVSLYPELRRFYRMRHFEKIGSAMHGAAMRAP